MQSIDLTDLTVRPDIIEIVPEWLAREFLALPLSTENGILTLTTCEPSGLDAVTMERLRFMLNSEIRLVLASREQIVEAINRHYGPPRTKPATICL
jgi:type IV pilus assembly protein PilB